MRILHIEEWSAATNAFIQELHAGTGCSIEHAQTIDEGLLKIEQCHGTIDIVLYSVGQIQDDVLRFPEIARAAAAHSLMRCPQFIALASSPLPLPCAVKCSDQQVVYLLSDFPKQIIEVARVMLWRIRTSKPGPTIRIVFQQGHYRFFVCGTTGQEEIRLGAQLGRLLLLLLGRTYTVEMLANALGVSRQSVKKYMHELRRIINSILERMYMTAPARDVAYMRRGSGGTLCGLRAKAVWGEES